MLVNEIDQITNERGRDYSHPLPNHLRISLSWSIEDAPFLHNPISVAKKMSRLKLDRDVDATKWDNYRDTMGYMACIDKMCQLYYKIKFGSISGDYSELGDKAKENLANELRVMSFGEQYGLMLKCMEYENEQE